MASQKGGSGKTTLAGHSAVQAQLAGAGPVVLIDIDPPASLADWWNERDAELPAFAETTVSRLAADLVALRKQGFRLAVIDTRRPAPAHHQAMHVHIARANPSPDFRHVVQLGAFSSARNAERARVILAKHNPQLRGHDFLITRATVHGRSFWRVVASGFDSAAASDSCARLKHHGGACFAYAENHAPMGENLALADRRGTHFPADRRR